MTPAEADVLDSLLTLGRADCFTLQDHTGRKLKTVRHVVGALRALGYAETVGRSPFRGGQPPLLWAATKAGKEVLP
jgi:hypothetical protein